MGRNGGRNFKIDKIKIDRSFVESAECEPEAAALIRALMGLGHGLGLMVTAAGTWPRSGAGLRNRNVLCAVSNIATASRRVRCDIGT
jgi:predicted signal transduction protein with EAL and GGDEF domain